MELVPRLIRPVPKPLGVYIRPGRNDHRVLTQLLSEERSSMSGVVFDPRHVDRQEELRLEVHRQTFETVLDPLALELSTPGGFNKKLAALPWGGPEPHQIAGLKGAAGRALVDTIANYVATKNFKAVLAPAHYISDVSDQWFEVDRHLVHDLRERLDSAGKGSVLIYYPLIIAGSVLRNPLGRQVILEALQSCPIDAIWLRVHPFGTRASGPVALRGYIEACQEFHRLGIPIVAERTGTVGIALLAFGAVGGVETGITVGGDFDVTRLLRPPKSGGKAFLPAPRVYIPPLGSFLSKRQAEQFFESRQMKSAFGCRNERCCRRGVIDMLNDPRRHFLITRLGEVGRLSRVPPQLRPGQYLDEFLRPATDLAVRAIRFSEELKPIQQQLESWRLTLGSIMRSAPVASFSPAPEGRRIEHRRGA